MEASERISTKDICEISNFFVNCLVDLYLNQLKNMANSFSLLDSLYKIPNLKIILSRLTCIFCNWLY